jgi:antitoxin (DNA-binding transcriptional repressor) of toxin-antitoxin stability system
LTTRLSIVYRDLRGRSGQVWKELARERDLVLTSNGRPVAILSAVSEDSLEESLAAVRQARAVAAVAQLQARSVTHGKDAITAQEVDREISAARRGRRR